MKIESNLHVPAAAFASMLARRSVAAHLDFLLHVAHLPRLSVAMAQAISGRNDAAQLLDALTEAGIPIDKTSPPVQLYSFQPPFRSFLLEQAGLHFLPEKQARLSAQAAQLLEQQGWLADALHCLTETCRWSAALALIGRSADGLLRQGGRHEVLAWLSKLPPAVALREPDCQFWLGRALPMARWRDKLRAYDLAARLYRHADRRAEAVDCLASALTILYRSGLASTGAALLQRLRELDTLLARQAAHLPAGIRLQAYEALTAALDFVGLRERMLQRWALRLAQLLGAAEARDERHLRGATTLLRFYVARGYPARARDLIEASGARHAGLQLPPRLLVRWDIVCGEFHLVAGEYAHARAVLGRARSRAEKAGLARLRPAIVLHELYLCLVDNALPQAAGHLALLEAQMQACSNAERILLLCARAWHAMLKQRAADALVTARAAARMAARLGMPLLLYFSKLHLLTACLATGELEKARRLHEHLLAQPDLRGNGYFLPQLKLAEARLAGLHGDDAGLAAALREALQATRSAPQLSVNLWLPVVTAELCSRALDLDVEAGWIRTLIRARRLPAPQQQQTPAWPWPLRIYVLGPMSIWRDGQRVALDGKTRSRPLALLKALIALGGESVDIALLSNLLWPELDGDAALPALLSGLHRLRRLLGYEEAIALSDRKLSLNFAYCWVDAREFERIVSLNDDQDRPGHNAEAARPTVAQALELYRSDFLADEDLLAWSLPMRNRLLSKFLRLLTGAGAALEEAGHTRAAMALYERGLEADSLSEELYLRLMLCHRRLGEPCRALEVYRRCLHVLSIVLSIAPSQRLRQLHERLLLECPGSAGSGPA